MSRARASLVVAIAGALVPSGACSAGAPAVAPEPASIGEGGTRVTVAGDGRAIVLSRDGAALLRLGADAFQLGTVTELDEAASYDPVALAARGEEEAGVTFRAPEAFHVTTTGSAARIDLDYGAGLSAAVTVRYVEHARFSIDVVPSDARADEAVALVRVRARTSGDPNEGFYGLGEWEDSVDHRGEVRPMQVEADLSLESSANEDHVPVPLLLGTRGWGMFVASRRVGAFDVAAKDPSAIEATFAVAPAPRGSAIAPPAAALAPSGPGAEPLRIWLFAEPEPLDLLRHYYALTGAPKLPAPWALGPWIWRNESRDQAEVEDDIRTIRALDLATSGIWIDRPYATAVNSFDFDPAKYPDAEAMIGRAHAAGLRLALWSTPYLEEATGELRAEATRRGFFPPQGSIPLNSWSAPLDFTNEEARAFWTGLVRRYTDMGVDGFKLDYGEDIAPSLSDRRNVWRFRDGSDERTMHHGYSRLYHRAYADALPDERFLLCRAAHWGEQVDGCVIWPGDMDATFTRHGERFTTREGEEVAGVGGLPATIIMGLSLGASGFPFFGADTGGYRHSPPDAELFARWVEQTALSTVMQVGDGSSEPPWVMTQENGRDEATLDIYRTYARLHARLFPYEWTYATRIAQDGRPIQRPLGLAYPALGVHPDDAYMFGDDLLVAPVVERGARTKTTVLPPGEWIGWWDGEPVRADASGRATLDAPLDRLPLLLRAGAIVPMLRPTIDTLAAASDPGVESFARDPGALWVRLAPGPPRRFTLWDGTSIRRDAAGAVELAGGAVFSRGFMLEVMARPEPSAVERDGAPLARAADLAALDAVAEGWAWEPARRGTLWVKVLARARVSAR